MPARASGTKETSTTGQQLDLCGELIETLRRSRARSDKVVEVVGSRGVGVGEGVARLVRGYGRAVARDGAADPADTGGHLELGKTSLNAERCGGQARSQRNGSGTSGEDDSVKVVFSPVPAGRAADVVIGGSGRLRVRAGPHDDRVFGDGRVRAGFESRRVVLGEQVPSFCKWVSGIVQTFAQYVR